MAKAKGNKRETGGWQDDGLRMKAYLAGNLNSEEIAELTGWTPERIAELQAEVERTEEHRVTNTRPETLFTRMVIQGEQAMRDLDDIALESRAANQPAAAVGAIKTKQNILKEILVSGQSLGIIRKQVDTRVLILGNIGTDDLKTLVAEKLASMQDNLRMVGRRFADDQDEPPPRPKVAESSTARQVVALDNDEMLVVRRKAVQPRA